MLLYHTTDFLNRESILIDGIDNSIGVSPWDSPQDPINFPQGNYLWLDIKNARKYGFGMFTGDPFDIWIVDIPKKDLIEDPITAGGLYSIKPIGKELIVGMYHQAPL